METLAFIHAHVDYEDPSPSPELRSFEPVRSTLSHSTTAGLIGSAALAIAVTAPNAQAVVQRGDTCAAVGSVQTALQARGFSTGGVDSSFGGQTEFAVLQFQRSNNLGADGVVGATTAQALGLDPAISCGTAAAPVSDAAPASTTAAYRVSSSSGLNVRSGPGSGFAVTSGLADGAVVQASSVVNNGYRQLSTGGWVSSEYLVSTTAIAPATTSNSGIGGTSTPVATAAYRVSSVSGLNVRSGPGSGFAVIGGLADGAVVQASSVVNNGYRQLSTGGWVASEYLVSAVAGVPATSATSAGGGGGAPGSVVRVNTNSDPLNVRSGPGSGYEVVGTLNDGTRLQTTGRTIAEWVELSNGRWVSSSWVERL